jgi:hypothetical protein
MWKMAGGATKCGQMGTDFPQNKYASAFRLCQQLLLLQLLRYVALQASLLLPHVMQHVLPKEDFII